MTLRLTFNKPMVARYFDGEDSVAMRVKIDDGVAMFLPVQDTKGKDVLLLQTRKRGGAEAVVEGAMGEDLQAALTSEIGPFFTLQRRQGGWLAAVPWPREAAPPKPEPHVRAWNAEDGSASSQPVIENLPDLVNLVRASKKIVDEFTSARRPGRPPTEVLEAREHLAMFQQLVDEVMPARSAVDAAMVTQARDLLARALQPNEAPTEVPPAPEPPAQTIVSPRAKRAGKRAQAASPKPSRRTRPTQAAQAAMA